LSSGKLPWMPFSSSPPNGAIGEDHVHPVALAEVGELETKGVAGIDLRRVEPVQKQVHLHEKERRGLASQPKSEPSCRVRRC